MTDTTARLDRARRNLEALQASPNRDALTKQIANTQTLIRHLTRTRYCPRCTTHPLVYGRHGDDPWAYCTNPTCTYEH